MREPFVQADRLELPEGLWTEVVRRSGAPGWSPEPQETGPSRSRRAVVIAVAFIVFAAAAVFAWQALAPAERHSRPADPSPSPAAPDLDPLASIPVGWSELPAPPEVRSEAASAWTGHDLLTWGGYVFEGSGDKSPNDDGFIFDAVSQSWSMMPVSPLSSRSAAASAWTGSELVIWGGWDGTDEGATPGVLGDGAAYDPAAGSWRMLPPAPISGRAPLSAWTGTELIVWGSEMRTPDLPRDGAAYDPAQNTWRAIAPAPIELSDATAVWTGREMIVFGAALGGGNDAATPVAVGAAYDPERDAWRRIADSELSPQASTAAWDGEAMIAWDYINASAAYDPAIDAWHSFPDVPLDAAECSPESVSVGSAVFGDYCGITTMFDPRAQRWTDLSRQAPSGGWVMEPVSTGDVVLIPAGRIEGSPRLFAFRPDLGDTNSQRPSVTVEASIETVSHLSPFPNAVAIGEGGVWVSAPRNDGSGGGAVVRVDPRSAEIIARIPVEHLPGWETGGGGLAAGEGSVWSMGGERVDGELRTIVDRIDPSSNRVVEQIDLGPGGPGDVWASDGSLWVVRFTDEANTLEVDRYDLAKGRVAARIPIPGEWSQQIFTYGDTVWVSALTAGSDDAFGGPGSSHLLIRIDAATDQYVGQTSCECGVLAPSGALIWASVDRQLHRYDAMTGADLGPAAATSTPYTQLVPDGEGGVWTFQADGGGAHGMFEHVDPSGTVVGTGSFARDEDSMWGGIATAFDPETNSLWSVQYEDSASVIRFRQR